MAILNPHDRLFHFTFRNPRHVACWLRHVLPAKVVAAIAWGTLALSSERIVAMQLRSHLPDLVYTARLVGSDEIVLLILEHKAHYDPALRSQVLRYVVHLRRAATKRGQPEPWVVPVVLHHGDEPFRSGTAPRGSHQAAFAAWQPHLRFVVDDLFGRSEAELRRPGLTALAQLTLLALACARRLEGSAMLAAIDRWGDLLRAVEHDDGPPGGDDALSAFGWYLLEATDVSPEDLHMALSKNLDQPNDAIMTTAQRLRLEGHSQGRTQGLTEGLTQGQVHILLRQLTKRFGPLSPELAHRVHGASQPQLDTWTDRVLDAKTLAEVFAD